MKKKEMDARKEQDSIDLSQNGIGQEDMLDLNSLLDVQGGQNENDRDVISCGLGCFSGAVHQQDQPSQHDDGER